MMSLLDLPNELLFIISEWFDLKQLRQLAQVNIRAQSFFESLIQDRYNKMAWMVVIEYIKTPDHHITICDSHLLLGWFYPWTELKIWGPSSNAGRAKYRLMKEGVGGAMVENGLRWGNKSRVQLSRGYYPAIGELTLNEWGSIPVCVVLGSDRKLDRAETGFDTDVPRVLHDYNGKQTLYALFDQPNLREYLM